MITLDTALVHYKLFPGAEGVLATAEARWSDWSEVEECLRQYQSLDDIVALTVSDNARRGKVIDALARLGARMGGDDDDAALCLVLLMSPALSEQAAYHGLDEDDLRSACWETVKRLNPDVPAVNLTHFMNRTVHRAKKVDISLLVDDREDFVPMEKLDVSSGSLRGHNKRVFIDTTIQQLSLTTAGAAHITGDQSPSSRLEELLAWGTDAGALRDEDLQLLSDLLAADCRRHDMIYSTVAAQYGVCSKTVQRRFKRIVSRLHDAGLTAS